MANSLERFWARTRVLVPVRNEGAAPPALPAEVPEHLPGVAIAVGDEGPANRSSAAAVPVAGVNSIRLSCRFGVGSAAQTGSQYARDSYGYWPCVDAAGQHPPVAAVQSIHAMRACHPEFVVSAHCGDGSASRGNGLRRMGLRGVAGFVSLICRRWIAEPISGFWLVRRPLWRCFSRIGSAGI